MGWYYGYNTKKDLIRELTRGSLAHSLRKEGHSRGDLVLWTIEQTKDKKALIVCNLIDNCSADWGYKPIDETMGPAYISCPISYLKRAKDLKGVAYSPKWRDSVLEEHRQLKDMNRVYKQGQNSRKVYHEKL